MKLGMAAGSRTEGHEDREGCLEQPILTGLSPVLALGMAPLMRAQALTVQQPVQLHQQELEAAPTQKDTSTPQA